MNGLLQFRRNPADDRRTVGRAPARERGESGAGMATARIVLGWIGVGFLAIGIVIGIASSV